MPKKKIKTKKQSGGIAIETILLTTAISSAVSMIGKKLFSYKKYLNAAKSYEEVLFVIQKNYESSKMFIEQNSDITSNLIRNNKIEIKFFENALKAFENNVEIKTEELNDEMKEYETKISKMKEENLLRELNTMSTILVSDEPCSEGKIRKPAKGWLNKQCEKGDGISVEDKKYDKPIQYNSNMYCCEEISLAEKSAYTLKRNIVLSKINRKKLIEDELDKLNDELNDLEFSKIQLDDQKNDYDILIRQSADKMKDLNRLSSIQVNMGNLLVEMSNKFKEEGIDISKEPYASKFKDKLLIQKIMKKVEEEGLLDDLEEIDSEKLKKQKKKNSDKFSPEIKQNIEKMEKINTIAFDIFKAEMDLVKPVKNLETTEKSDCESFQNRIKELEIELNAMKKMKGITGNQIVKSKEEEEEIIRGINNLKNEIDNIEKKASEKIQQLKQTNNETILRFKEKEEEYKREINNFKNQ